MIFYNMYSKTYVLYLRSSCMLRQAKGLGSVRCLVFMLLSALASLPTRYECSPHIRGNTRPSHCVCRRDVHVIKRVLSACTMAGLDCISHLCAGGRGVPSVLYRVFRTLFIGGRVHSCRMWSTQSCVCWMHTTHTVMSVTPVTP